MTPAFWVQIACRITTEVVGPGHQTQSSRSGAAGVGDGWQSLPGPGWPGCLGRLAGPNWGAKRLILEPLTRIFRPKKKRPSSRSCFETQFLRLTDGLELALTNMTPMKRVFLAPKNDGLEVQK